MSSKSPVVWGVLGVLVGVALGYFYAAQTVTSRYEAQIEVARNTVPSVSALYFVAGTVKDVRDASIVLGELAFSGDPFLEAPSEVEVVVGPDTTILKRVYKDLGSFQGELQEYQRRADRLPPGSPPLDQPVPYVETEVTVGDLQEGVRVEVHSAVDIKGLERFEASRIIFQ